MNTRKALKWTIGFALLGLCSTTSWCSQKIEKGVPVSFLKNFLSKQELEARIKTKAALDAQKKEQAQKEALAKLSEKKQVQEEVSLKKTSTVTKLPAVRKKVIVKKQIQATNYAKTNKTVQATVVVHEPRHSHFVKSYCMGSHGMQFPVVKWVTCFDNPCYK